MQTSLILSVLRIKPVNDRRKTLLILIISIFLSSCNEKGNDKKLSDSVLAPYNIVSEGDGIKFNYDSLSKDITNYGFNSLKKFKYEFPARLFFQKRIEEVYGIDITKYQNKIIALRRSGLPEIVIKKERYILVQDNDADNEFYINPEILYCYNNYIFKNDKSSLSLLKAKASYLLKDLVVYYGYNKDKDLTQFVLKDFAFGNAVEFHNLIFSKNNNRFILRHGILDDIENIIYKGKTKELMSEAKEEHGYDSLNDIMEIIIKDPAEYKESDRSIAFLCEKSLNVGDLGTVQSFLHKHQLMKARLAKQNYYNFERLRIFIENIDVIDHQEGGKLVTINDPDGYTNLRKGKNIKSEILQKVNSGESIAVINDTGDWVLVKTKEGNKGYIHKSRMKSE